MNHGPLLVTLIVLLTVATGGVFVLVNQESETLVFQEESLVGGIALVGEEFNEEVYPPAGGNGGGADEKVIEGEQIPSSTEVSGESEQDPNQEVVEESSDESESVEQSIGGNQIVKCEIDAAVTPQQDTVVLNEIAWMGTPHSSADEWPRN